MLGLTTPKLDEFSVAPSIASEKVAEIAAVGATEPAPDAGEVLSTVGGVVSTAAAVVKFQA